MCEETPKIEKKGKEGENDLFSFVDASDERTQALFLAPFS